MCRHTPTVVHVAFIAERDRQTKQPGPVTADWSKNQTQSRTGGGEAEKEHKGSSRSSSILKSSHLELLSSYPALYFLASDPFSLNTHSAHLFSSSFSLAPAHPHLTQL